MGSIAQKTSIQTFWVEFAGALGVVQFLDDGALAESNGVFGGCFVFCAFFMFG